MNQNICDKLTKCNNKANLRVQTELALIVIGNVCLPGDIDSLTTVCRVPRRSNVEANSRVKPEFALTKVVVAHQGEGALKYQLTQKSVGFSNTHGIVFIYKFYFIYIKEM